MKNFEFRIANCKTKRSRRDGLCFCSFVLFRVASWIVFVLRKTVSHSHRGFSPVLPEQVVTETV
jgi:hypothetical protein